MLVVRLQRTGRKNLPAYRIVVAEKARPVKGKYLEIVGHYLPASYLACNMAGDTVTTDFTTIK